ncbi:MAG: hypothetical protein FNT29_08080 [Halothiobacillaceae bacterium]|nr:MAG: hypothetical protein FNT29_09060 [Halothiobacillaceae bacterium]TQV63005.1 MAG: hypothetical protein FNT29_08080 [Halothiobacillaceae bacterium]
MHDEHAQDSTETRIISAAHQRRAASWFDYGNLIVITLAGIPLLLAGSATGKTMIFATAGAIIPIILWFGGSMLLYALNKHHPNPRVGHYTQWAAYRFYAVTGSLIVIGTFFPSDITYYQVFWAMAAAILIPWSIMDLRKIQREDWRPIETPVYSQEEHH